MWGVRRMSRCRVRVVAARLPDGRRLLMPEQDRDRVAMEDLPAGVGQEPSGQAAVGADPDDLEPLSAVEGVPFRPPLQGVDILEDRLLAEQLETVVEEG